MTVYCVWAWYQYYPDHGNGNLKGMFFNEEDALNLMDELRNKEEDPYDYVELTTEQVQGERREAY